MDDMFVYTDLMFLLQLHHTMSIFSVHRCIGYGMNCPSIETADNG